MRIFKKLNDSFLLPQFTFRVCFSFKTWRPRGPKRLSNISRVISRRFSLVMIVLTANTTALMCSPLLSNEDEAVIEREFYWIACRGRTLFLRYVLSTLYILRLISNRVVETSVSSRANAIESHMCSRLSRIRTRCSAIWLRKGVSTCFRSIHFRFIEAKTWNTRGRRNRYGCKITKSSARVRFSRYARDSSAICMHGCIHKSAAKWV